LLTKRGWILSPAFDINPSTDKVGLALNIDTENNALDFELAKSVGDYFQITEKERESILNEVKTAVSSWKIVAQELGISRTEQEVMASSFRL
jgi:serine/threonine-protein kinase HipA